MKFLLMGLYPLKFETIFKEKIWGGNRIKDVLGKDFSPLPNCGETWELSGVKDNISVVSEGLLKGKNLLELLKKYKEELVGHKVYQSYGNEFPLLVKFIDANDDLSIQVHPNDQQAKKYQSFGKSEMWYVLDADPNAELFVGFKKDTTKAEFRKKVENGELLEILNTEKVNTDDIFYLPAGRVHSIGSGILLAEIQQSSDITFRIYDFDRMDTFGNKRELHIDEALDVIDYHHRSDYKSTKDLVKNEIQQIVDNEYFTTNRLVLDKEINRTYDEIDSFIIYTCIEGSVEMTCSSGSYLMSKGDVYLVPACFKGVSLSPNESCKLLESHIS